LDFGRRYLARLQLAKVERARLHQDCDGLSPRRLINSDELSRKQPAVAEEQEPAGVQITHHNLNANILRLQASAYPSRLSGSRRTRYPLAAKIALPIAGATAGMPGSPRPVGA